ncbi:MAG: hypothetical protein GY794_16655 [bacterium]|nr:hypothetical protein [bacterium]
MKEKLSYEVSVCRLIALVGVAFLFGRVIRFSGFEISILASPSALAIILGFPFFMLLGSYGVDFLKFIPASIQCFGGKPSRPDHRYAEIAKFGSRYIIAGAVIYGLMGTMNMLANLSDPSGLGTGLSKVMIGPFYAVVISELFFAFVYMAFSDSSPTPPASDVEVQEGSGDE